MEKLPGLLLIVMTCIGISAGASAAKSVLPLFKADNPYIQYVGRVDFSSPQLPRMWAAGIYIKARFKGSMCQLLINDEVQYNNNHNYIEIVVDDGKPYRVQTTGKTNVIAVGKGLSNGIHTVLICKDTESIIGYIDFAGIRCGELLPPLPLPIRKIEYIGDSITSGSSSDLSAVPCGGGQWYDQHNAYMAYGPATSRNLNAQWQLTSVSGIGLVHSCCDMKILMPQVYDKVYQSANTIPWDFKRYQPDVVAICLGENDGLQDSALFCSAYVKFIGNIRSKYPGADIVCLGSPMAGPQLAAGLNKYINAVTGYVNSHGDKKVSRYFFSKQYANGCGGHPDVAAHQLIAAALAGYLKKLKSW